MSAFEKLPREIRDLIYERCLMYDGQITPFLRNYERMVEDRPPQLIPWAGCERRRKDDLGPFVGYPRHKRNARQTEKIPCVALLRVNSTIRNEAAIILFGKNVWQLSSASYERNDRYSLWRTYAKYFRHIVTRFEARDVDETKLLDIEMREMARIEDDSEDSDHFDQAGSIITHQEKVSLLRDEFTAKRDILQRMNLKSLSLDFSSLSCPAGCCRREALQSCLVCLGSVGPWYRLERERDRGLEAKTETSVKVLGLKDEKERNLFWETWGLKVD